jgi:hypothetical protein
VDDEASNKPRGQVRARSCVARATADEDPRTPHFSRSSGARCGTFRKLNSEVIHVRSAPEPVWQRQPVEDPTPIEVIDAIIADASRPEFGATVEEWLERWVAPGGGE